MKINHETKIKISIVTDFITRSLENQTIIEKTVRIKDILNFINSVAEEDNIKTSVYKNSFLASFCESIICIKILSSSISWADIIEYNNIHNYYERM